MGRAAMELALTEWVRSKRPSRAGKSNPVADVLPGAAKSFGQRRLREHHRLDARSSRDRALTLATSAMSCSTFRFVLLGIAAALLTGCGTARDMVTSHVPTFRKGRPSVVVKLNQQKAV